MEFERVHFIEGLYQHQKQAVEFLLSHNGGCLFMEPGTGKTRAALEYMLQAKRGEPGTCIVFAPPICLSVWEEELAAVFPVPYHTFRLDKEGEVTWDRSQWAFFLVSYGWMLYHKSWLWFYEHTFDFGICDESHFIKSEKAQRTEAVFALYTQIAKKVCLTGTPVSNEVLDVYTQFKWASPEVFPEKSYREFADKWAIKGGYYKKSVVGVRNREKLVSIMAQGAYAVTKEECLDLPPLIVQKISVVMGRRAQQLHDELYLGMKAAIRSATQVEAKSPVQVLMQIGHKVMQLQRITGGFLSHIEGDGALEQIDNAKLKATVDLVQAIDKPVVIFVRFRAEIEVLASLLRAERVPTFAMTGDTDLSARNKGIDWFRKGQVRVLVMQEQLGLGVTLTAASYAIFFSWDYNYVNWKQCVDRLHRITQKNPVVCYLLCAKDSIDYKVARVLEQKGKLEDLVLSL